MQLRSDPTTDPQLPFAVTHQADTREPPRLVARFATERDAELLLRRSDQFGDPQLTATQLQAEVSRQVAEVTAVLQADFDRRLREQREELERQSNLEAERRLIQVLGCKPLAEVERTLIEAAMLNLGGYREKVARSLGIGIRTLHGKLKSYGWKPRQKAAA